MRMWFILVAQIEKELLWYMWEYVHLFDISHFQDDDGLDWTVCPDTYVVI